MHRRAFKLSKRLDGLRAGEQRPSGPLALRHQVAGAIATRHDHEPTNSSSPATTAGIRAAQRSVGRGLVKADYLTNPYLPERAGGSAR